MSGRPAAAGRACGAGGRRRARGLGEQPGASLLQARSPSEEPRKDGRRHPGPPRRARPLPRPEAAPPPPPSTRGSSVGAGASRKTSDLVAPSAGSGLAGAPALQRRRLAPLLAPPARSSGVRERDGLGAARGRSHARSASRCRRPLTTPGSPLGGGGAKVTRGGRDYLHLHAPRPPPSRAPGSGCVRVPRPRWGLPLWHPSPGRRPSLPLPPRGARPLGQRSLSLPGETAS